MRALDRYKVIAVTHKKVKTATSLSTANKTTSNGGYKQGRLKKKMKKRKSHRTAVKTAFVELLKTP